MPATGFSSLSGATTYGSLDEKATAKSLHLPDGLVGSGVSASLTPTNAIPDGAYVSYQFASRGRVVVVVEAMTSEGSAAAAAEGQRLMRQQLAHLDEVAVGRA